MTTKTDRKHLLALPLGGLLLAAACGAWAGSPAFSSLVAEANTAETAVSNPAGMSRLHGTRMTIQGMVAASQGRFNVDEKLTNVDGGDPKKGDQPTYFPQLYYVRQLNDRWHAGLSLSVPSGFGADYGNTWAGRYNTVDFSLVYISLTPAVSYRISDSLSVGGAVNANYTSETSTVMIDQPFSDDDGKLTSDLSGVGFSVTLSALYEFSRQTRVGLSWTSDSDADMEGNLRLRKLNPRFDQIAIDLGIKNINTKLTNTLPQRAIAGLYHEFDSGNYMTVDALWMHFSDFKTTNLKLNGYKVNISQPDIYQDMYGGSVGAGFPASNRLTYKVGAGYLSSAVNNHDRTLALALDTIWAVGAGLTYELTPERSVDINASYINTGKSPVDTVGGLEDQRRVVGKSSDPYVILLELTYHL